MAKTNTTVGKCAGVCSQLTKSFPTFTRFSVQAEGPGPGRWGSSARGRSSPPDPGRLEGESPDPRIRMNLIPAMSEVKHLWARRDVPGQTRHGWTVAPAFPDAAALSSTAGLSEGPWRPFNSQVKRRPLSWWRGGLPPGGGGVFVLSCWRTKVGQKGWGRVERSPLTHWPTLRRAQSSCVWGGGHRQLLRLCHLEPARLVKKLRDGAACCRAEGEASAGGNRRGCRVGQDVPAPQRAGVSLTNYITVRQKSHKTPSTLIK